MTVGPRLYSLGLRGTALAGKFVVFIALARFLGDADVGRFGLIVVTVAYGTFIAGMEFYNYSVREVAMSSGARQARAIVNHIGFVVLMQVLMVVSVLALHLLGLLTFELAFITLLLTLVEHWAQEGYRTLVALSKPLAAAVSLFLRQGSWVFVVIGGFILAPDLRSLDFVLYSWLAGVGAAALVAGVIVLRETGRPKFSQLDAGWIRRGLPIAVVFLAAAVGLQTINFLDRVIQGQLGDEGALAAYVLFFGISVALIAALDAGVFSFKLPKIVAAGAEGSKASFSAVMATVLYPTLVGSALFFVCGALFFEFGLELLGIGRYGAYGPIFYTLMVAITFQALSMVPHLGLYALRHDKTIMCGNFMALVLFLGLVFLLRGQNETAVALARAGAFLFLAVWKGLFFLRCLKRLE